MHSIIACIWKVNIRFFYDNISIITFDYAQKEGVGMHLKEQLYILEIARTRNITKAAQALGVSQPALSAFLNNLELSLGTKLFERKRKCLELTPVGEIYVQKAEQMLHLKDEFYREMSQLLHEDQLELTVGVQTIRAPHIIAPLSIAISEHFPNLKVTFYENTGEILCRMFEEGKLDLLLCNKRETGCVNCIL